MLLVEACKSATESKLDLSIAEANYEFGKCHLAINNAVAESQDALQKALGAAVQITNHDLIQKITKELAALYKKRGSETNVGLSQKSIEFLQLAVEKTADNPAASISALTEMALLYNAYGKFQHAEESIDQAYLALGQKLGEKTADNP